MIEAIFTTLSHINTLYWGYIGFSLILGLGLFLSIKTRFFQLRSLPASFRTFFHFLFTKHGSEGVHPLRAFFASVGGMIGIGNIVGIVTALELGGPGALFWVWISGLFGSIIKYCEVFLGVKYRVVSHKKGYDGGPMYFLGKAFKSRFIPFLVATLLCLYGVEIYQFSVVTAAVTTNWPINQPLVIALLIAIIFFAALGGVNRVGKICSVIVPIFMAIYTLMALTVIGLHLENLPSLLLQIVKSAFTGHAAVGGFAGATMLLAIQQGASSAAYAADIGIGTDSIIQSESSTRHPEKQASLACLGVFLDNFICTLSMLVVLITGVWQTATLPSQYTQMALSTVFPGMSIFMPILFFVLGYMTMISYFCVGLKCARFLHPQKGVPLYLIYAFVTLLVFSFVDQTKTRMMMQLVGGLLLTVNLIGVYKLRKEIHFG